MKREGCNEQDYNEDRSELEQMYLMIGNLTYLQGCMYDEIDVTEITREYVPNCKNQM